MCLQPQPTHLLWGLSVILFTSLECNNNGQVVLDDSYCDYTIKFTTLPHVNILYSSLFRDYSYDSILALKV